MTPPRALLLLPAAALACASAQRPEARPRPPRRFALVARADALRIRPEANAPALSLRHEGPLAFRRVRARGAYVELETITAPERQCAPALVAPRGVRLRFFVPATALSAAVSRPFHAASPESSLTVAIGAPVQEADRAEGVVVLHAGLRVAMRTVPDTARAFPEPHAESTPERAERLRPGTRASLPDGASVTVADAPPVLVFLRSPAGSNSRVVVATPCVRFETVVPSTAVLPVLDVELPDHTVAHLPRRILRAGAALRWPDGSPAGRTTAAVPLSDEGRSVGAMRCMHVPLHTSDAPDEVIDAEVCADEGDVSEAQ